MKQIFKTLELLLNDSGAIIFGVNRQLALNTPIEKSPPSEVDCINKSLHDSRLLDTIIAINDEIDLPHVPEGALIKGAKVLIDGTAGAAGIFSLGHRAFTDRDGNSVAEDLNAFVLIADAGGQAVNARDGVGSKLGAILGIVGKGGMQLVLKCTEATLDTVANPVTIEIFVDYQIES